MAYPSVVSNFSTKVNGQIIDASHINDLQTDVVALETFVGTLASAAGTLISDVRASSSDGGGHVQSANKGGTGQTAFTKGDILVATSASVLSKLAVSTDGLFLVADSTQATGVKWGGTTNNLSLSAGQTIRLGNALVVGNGVVSSIQSQVSDNDVLNAFGTQWVGQTFTTSSIVQVISKVTLNIAKVLSPAGNCVVDLYTTSSSNPVSVIGTFTTAASNIGVKADVDITYSPAVSVLGTTKYAVVLKVPSGDSSNKIQLSYATGGGYGGGNDIYTVDGGSNWTQDTGDARFKIHEIQTIPGKAYLAQASASVQGEFTDNFIGFANAAAAVSSTVSVNSTIDTNQSSLVTGYTYYLSNTPGAINSVAGTFSRKVGLSVSSVTVLVKFDNP